MLFVHKKDRSLCLCVDFRGLNKISKKDRYPLLFISNLLTTAGKARLYTTIDRCHAYHLVCISEGDKWKTAFHNHYRTFKWLVTPFGLTNAPVAFQRFMNDIFSDLLDINVIIYLDDILVYSDDPTEHTEHIHEVLRHLRKHSLFACPDKCHFSEDSVEYLGFILSKEGLEMDQSKVQAIQDWPEPRKVKDIQSFLGFANFYRVRLESGEVGTELRNTLGGGKTQESGNAEGMGKQKCGRCGKAEMRKEQKCGKHRKAEKQNVIE